MGVYNFGSVNKSVNISTPRLLGLTKTIKTFLFIESNQIRAEYNLKYLHLTKMRNVASAISWNKFETLT